MHLRQTSDASAAVVASAVSTSSFSSCFSLRFFCALLLKFLPAVSHRRSHTLLSPLSTPLFLLLSLVLCPPSDLSLSLSAFPLVCYPSSSSPRSSGKCYCLLRLSLSPCLLSLPSPAFLYLLSTHSIFLIFPLIAAFCHN